MFSKTLSLTFVAVAVMINQTLAAPKEIDRNILADDETIDGAKKLLGKVEAEIVKKGEAAKGSLHALTKSTDEDLNTISKDGKKKVNETFEKLSEELDKIKSDAESNKKNISECLTDREEAFKGLPSKYSDFIDASSLNKVYETSHIITLALTSVQETYDVIEKAKRDLKECKGDDDKKCISDVVSKAKEAQGSIPKEIDETVSKATEEVKAVVETMKTDVENHAKQTDSEGQRLLDAIKTCASKQKSV